MRRLTSTRRLHGVLSFVACLGLGSSSQGEAAAVKEPAPPAGDSFSLEAKGDLEAALTAAERVMQNNPKGYFPRLRVAYLELVLKDYAAAAKDYRVAGELAPRSVEALLGEQQALIALESYVAAEPVGREILARDADNYLASSRLAWTLFNLRRYGEAAKLYARVLTLYPGDLEMMLGLGYSLLRSGRKPQAAEAFRTVLAISPANQRAREALAACR
jgi:tetratricopeptide (TPR) repeat protein